MKKRVTWLRSSLLQDNMLRHTGEYYFRLTWIEVASFASIRSTENRGSRASMEWLRRQTQWKWILMGIANDRTRQLIFRDVTWNSAHEYFYYFHSQSVSWNFKKQLLWFFINFTRKGSKATRFLKTLTNIFCVYSHEVIADVLGEIVLPILTSHYVAPCNDYLHGLISNFKDRRVLFTYCSSDTTALLDFWKHTEPNIDNRSICESTMMWHIKLVLSRYYFSSPPFPQLKWIVVPHFEWLSLPGAVLTRNNAQLFIAWM